MKNKKYKGVFTAIITPFNNGKVDYSSFGKLIEHQVKSGVNGIVIGGTTGESSTLTEKEHQDIISFTVKKTNNRVKVIAGTGSNSTAETISMTKYAKKVGADACLLVNPYYNKPTQNGLLNHFKKISEEVSIDIFLYNIPGRTNISLTKETLLKLSKIKNIVVLKDATGDIDYTSDIIKNVNIELLSGNDTMNFPIIATGGIGIVSVLSNIYPNECDIMCQLMDEQDPLYSLEKARKLHFLLWDITNLLFEETNPIYIKEACKIKGLIKSNEIRLPLTNLSPEKRKKLTSAIKETDKQINNFFKKEKIT